MRRRRPRWGANLYEVRVSETLAPDGLLYLTADSITVTGGTLMLSQEMAPRGEESAAGEPEDVEYEIECPPGAIFAPGQWSSVLLVGRANHEVLLSQARERSMMDLPLFDEG
jgi:hypothetical protein